MNKINLGDILLCMMLTLVLYILYLVLSTPAHPSQTGVCCAITVEHTSSHTATVHYWSSNSDESFDMYAEVEYPDEDYTTEEQLQLEIEYAINQMQEMCYHNHMQTPEDAVWDRQDEIEERAYNMKDRECYTWQDIEMIVFGELQE